MAVLTVKNQFLGKSEITACHRRSGRFFILIAAIYAGIFGVLVSLHFFVATGVADHFHLLVAGTLAFLAIGLLQYHLLHAAHEASHQDFHPRSKTGLLVALLVAYPIGLTRSFRDEHWRHHRYFGDPERDPDFPTYGVFPKSKAAFLVFLLFNLSGLAAVEQFLGRLRAKAPVTTDRSDMIWLLSTQGFLLVALSAVFNPLYYFLFWLAPVVTLVKTLAQLRGLVEHGSPATSATLRTFLDGGFMTRLLGNIGFRHHAEHHLYPMVPYENLERIRTRMLSDASAAKHGGVMIELCEAGHLQLLCKWFSELPWIAPPTARN